jgi:hypothetical protein
MSTRIEINVQTSEQVVLELTAEELAKKAAEIEAQAAEQAAKPYFEKRAAEYPPMTDYLDGVVKGDQTQIDKYIADCLAVKAKYPKG